MPVHIAKPAPGCCSPAWLCLLLALWQPLQADEDRAAFEVQSAHFRMDGSLLHLDAEFNIRLPSYIDIAIDQGFAVPLMFEIEILAHNKYWIDEKLISFKQRYQLHYLPMLDAQVVFDVNARRRYYFERRGQALRYLETVYDYPMLDTKNFVHNRQYYARLRMGIDSDTLPLPLKSSSLWNNDWNLRSDWWVWEVALPK